MKNVVKCWKDFLSYFTTLETYRDVQEPISESLIFSMANIIGSNKQIIKSNFIFGIIHIIVIGNWQKVSIYMETRPHLLLKGVNQQVHQMKKNGKFIKMASGKTLNMSKFPQVIKGINLFLSHKRSLQFTTLGVIIQYLV